MSGRHRRRTISVVERCIAHRDQCARALVAVPKETDNDVIAEVHISSVA